MMTKLKVQLFEETIGCICFLSNDSDFLVFGNYVGNISVFSTKSNKNVWTNKDSGGNYISSVTVSPNDDIVAGGGGKKCLIVISAVNGDSICSVGVDSSIHRVLFLSQHKIACVLDNGTVAIVCWQTKKIEKILKVGNWAVCALAISPVSSDILLTGDNVGVIKQTIISSQKTVMVYEGHASYVKDLSFLSCGNMFVSGSYDQTARLFALDQKQAIRVFKGHTGGIRSVSLIHDDELMITSSWDDTVKLWKIDGGECLSTVKTEQDVRCGAASKDEQLMVVGGSDGKVTIFSFPPRSAVSLDRKLKLSK